MQLLEELRPAAFAIAYRMLGSAASAEDVVQEGLLRLHRALEAGERIESPSAYLSTVVTRLAIDELRSARVRRERYVGEWLPEPILTSEEADPSLQAQMADSLSLAFLTVLESLTPEQRAVFLLREVFDYPYEDIAGVVGRTEPAVRKLASRARRQLEEGRPRFEVSREQRERLADGFFAAMEDGDLTQLESLLAADVVLHGDGGGKVPAIARPLHGRARVAKALAAWIRAAAVRRLTLERVEVNGQPGATLLASDGGLAAVLVLQISAGRIESIMSVVNPDKLAHLGVPMAGVAALWGRRGDPGPTPAGEAMSERERER